MAETLNHRGPDAIGGWAREDSGVALGFRRLAIIDLTEAGHQPMLSSDGRYAMVFNGEIYNHRSLRATLEQEFGAVEWRGHSDTETLIESIGRWGWERTLSQISGMFAIALWDNQERVLRLARDRFGEKPLYYGRLGEEFVFGSELKVFHENVRRRRALGEAAELRVDDRAVAMFFRYGYVPAPRSIFEGVFKLEPGAHLEVSAEGHAPVKVCRYWDAQTAAQESVSEGFEGDSREAEGALEKLLTEVVRTRMESDVPLGAFLSGGIDSSLIVALMQQQSSRPVQTFTIGFTEPEYNEAPHARAVAKHLGTDHTEWIISPEEAMEVIPRLPSLYDEPFADSSQIPTTLVSAMTRRHVKVSLSGDGGDELFGGYNRYFWAERLWNKMGKVPAPLRRFAGSVLKQVPNGVWTTVERGIAPLLPKRIRNWQAGERAAKAIELLELKSQADVFAHLVSTGTEVSTLLRTREEGMNPWLTERWPELSYQEAMMLLDTETYLPDDILVKVDRASMGVSLESRAPYLDEALFRLAWRLPQGCRIRGTVGKAVLRSILYKHVPRELIERPKMGFGVPVKDWVRGPLRDWAEDLLSDSSSADDGVLDRAGVRNCWNLYLSGRGRLHTAVWCLLMWKAWHRRWLEGGS